MTDLKAFVVTVKSMNVVYFNVYEHADEMGVSVGFETLAAPRLSRIESQLVFHFAELRLSADFKQEREAHKNDPKKLLELYQREWGKIDKFMTPLSRGPRTHKSSDAKSQDELREHPPGGPQSSHQSPAS